MTYGASNMDVTSVWDIQHGGATKQLAQGQDRKAVFAYYVIATSLTFTQVEWILRNNYN